MAKVRSPNYPSLDLGAALVLARKVFDKDNRNKVSREAIGKHLGHESLSGPALGKIGALRAYDLVTGSGDELRVSDDAVTALMAPEKSPDRKTALARLAMNPDIFKEIRKDFPGTVSEDNLRFWLIKRKFATDAATTAAKSYIETMKLVEGEKGSYNLDADKKKTEIKHGVAPKVGDYVQWTSGGADQFPMPRKVTSISEDGMFALVHGSLTGVPMSELAVTEAPKPPLTGSDKSLQAPDINILMSGQRLQITADVDLGGVAKLKEALAKYEELLKLLA